MLWKGGADGRCEESLALKQPNKYNFNWTPSTGRVPMRSLPLALLLIGVQAVLNMGPVAANHSSEHYTASNQSSERHTAANHRAEQSVHLTGSHREQQQPVADTLSQEAHRAALLPQDKSSSLGHSETDSTSIPEVDPKLFSKRRYRSSPRVVFSDVRPTHAVVGETMEEDAGLGGGVRGRRSVKMQHFNRGEYSVCDSINEWVNLTKATDMAGNEVAILPEVKINNNRMKQFFYQTVCHPSTPQEGGAGGGPRRGSGGGARGGARGGVGGVKGSKAKSGCRGIDSRHWNSYCTNTHTFVRALTKFKELTAWRLVRINSACVCVISRKSWH
ncbi:hypothetical protein UPYG_G00001070 [Umbra pygmaea]|uniref:Nerve growth factor-related domain-containing protein n=1 Tax=Umbra pygmaea TaxID=75934 RepID=A0ABD0XGA8_UMBPY